MTGGRVSVNGILFTTGAFEATGTGTIYGSVVARGGVVQAVSDGSRPTPDLYWNPEIASEWPPAAWSLPRAVVTSWSTEP